MQDENKISLEFGTNKSNREKISSDKAHKFNVNGKFFNKFLYSFENVYAGPNFFGYYNDMQNTSGRIDFPVYKKLSANIFISNYKNNLDFDSNKIIAIKENTYLTGIMYSLNSDSNFTLDFKVFFKQDYLLPADYNYEEKTITFGIKQNFDKFSFQTYLEKGRFDDKLNKTINDNLERYNIYAYYYRSDNQTYSFYTRIGHENFTGFPERTKSAGVSYIRQTDDDIYFKLDYQKNNFDSDKQKKQDNIFLNLIYNLLNNHSLSLQSNWIKSYDEENNDKYLISLIYTIPFDIPITKKKSIGIIKGRVFDDEKIEKPSIPNVLLKVNEVTAVTNQNGEFVFPSLKPDIYYLWIEKAFIGLNRVTTEKLPLKVEVKSGEITLINVGVVNSSKIFGKTLISELKKDENSEIKNDKFVDENIKEKIDLANILVELSNKKEVLQQLTDEKGDFFFKDIRPGNWVLKVYDNGNLPLHHYFEEKEFQFYLEPDEEKEISLKILKRLRHIKNIDEGEIKMEK